MTESGGNMKQGSGFTVKLFALLVAVALVGVLHLRAMNRQLECNQRDQAVTSQDLSSRRAGCEHALEDMSKFEEHITKYIKEKEEDITSLTEKIEETRRRIGSVERIKEEYEKLENELEEVRKILSLVERTAGGRR